MLFRSWLPPGLEVQGLFGENLLLVQDPQRNLGLVTRTGETVLPPVCRWIGPLSEGLAAAEQEDSRGGVRWGYLNESGELAISPVYEEARPFSEGLAAVRWEGQWGFVDRTGDLVVLPAYDWVSDFDQGLAAARALDGAGHPQYRLLDQTGRAVLSTADYDYLLPAGGGMALVAQGTSWRTFRWGILEQTGRLAAPLQYDWAEPFSEDLALVRLEEKWGFLDRSGRVTIPLVYDSACSFSGGLAYV